MTYEGYTMADSTTQQRFEATGEQLVAAVGVLSRYLAANDPACRDDNGDPDPEAIADHVRKTAAGMGVSLDRENDPAWLTDLVRQATEKSQL